MKSLLIVLSLFFISVPLSANQSKQKLKKLSELNKVIHIINEVNNQLSPGDSEFILEQAKQLGVNDKTPMKIQKLGGREVSWDGDKLVLTHSGKALMYKRMSFKLNPKKSFVGNYSDIKSKLNGSSRRSINSMFINEANAKAVDVSYRITLLLYWMKL